MECVFCNIISGKWRSSKIWENEDFLAILDINPNTKGVSLVIPKKHITSDFLKIDVKTLHKAIEATKIVSQKIKTALSVDRVGLIIEGIDIDHFHIKLYPIHGLTELKKDGMDTERIYFEKYPGYLTSKLGPRWNKEDLERIVSEVSRIS